MSGKREGFQCNEAGVHRAMKLSWVSSGLVLLLLTGCSFKKQKYENLNFTPQNVIRAQRGGNFCVSELPVPWYFAW